MGHLWVPVFLLVVFSCTGADMQTFALQFTQELYNTSIHENSAAKTFTEGPTKMGVYLLNSTWDIWYRIESGDSEGLFKAERYVLGDFCFLRIRTQGGGSALNREVRDQYSLTVRAMERHTGVEAHAAVNVRVLDANDLRPLFLPTSYSLSVPENTPIRTSVGQVTATDADIGANGEHYFSLKERSDTFAIHPTSGVITLTGRLDYLETPRYAIEVLALDRGLRLHGNNRFSSEAKLSVRVLQANEHAPVITAVPLMPWSGAKDPTYAFVTVEDADEGQNGGVAELSVVAGDPLQQFTAVRTEPGGREFKIKATKEVEWEGYGFNLTLQARDTGSPPRFSAPRVVKVQSPRQYLDTLKFEKSVYQVSLSEFAPPNSSVVMVRAVPKHPNIRYSMQQRMWQHRNPFTINPNTGLITTTAPVQADLVSKYEFEVLASDMRTTAKVVVRILDMNNNAPKFHRSAYETSVDENVPVGTSILTVSASDADDGENGYVTYSVAGASSQPFAVDYFTGVIRTAVELDFEMMPSRYDFRVRASDWGSPFRREAEVTVSITLNNLNDNKPLMESSACDVMVPRATAAGQPIITVSATDADDLGLVRYEISAGNNLELFDLDPSSGVLSLKKPLNDADAVKLSLHTLQITANDGEMSGSPLLLNISIASALKRVDSKCVQTGVLRDLAGLLLFGIELSNQMEPEDELADIYSVNDHTPLFLASCPSVVEVREDLPVGSSLLRLSATDADAGFNGKLLFVISGGDTDSCFSIEQDSGWLTIYEPLDREATDHYTLNMTVYDLGSPQKSSWCLLEIKVLDANDNSPEFSQSRYSAQINENAVVGGTIIQLEATDKDYGVNGMVRYKFLTATDKFVIDQDTGIVAVNSSLDREINKAFVLQVAAHDLATGEPQMISTVLLSISLDDVNDNAPRFVPSCYHARLHEDLPVGTLVLWLDAHDPDLGQAGEVRFSLEDDGGGSFRLDKVSGALYLAKALDFESTQFYNLTAKAEDGGSPDSLSSTCFITVEIVDVNENLYSPSFPFFVDWGSVGEDAPLGTSVMKVTALDEDSDRDADILYSIREGSGLGVFTIDAESGVISTQGLLDRETTSHYWLTVYATDQGIVPRSASVEVYIEVQDINDNAPQTSEPVYYASVSENSPKDVSIFQMEAFDPDSKTSNNLFYKITSGNPQGFLTINPETGLVLTTARKLDRENQEEHILEITISDRGNPPRTTPVRLIVAVLDQNDNSPQFLEKVFKIKLPARAQALRWEPVYRVIARDKDEGVFAEITYRIEEGNDSRKFHIDAKTGVLSSKEAFSAGEHNILTIKAVDNGLPQRSSICRLHIEWISRPKPSPKALLFEEDLRMFSVLESDPVAHMVGVIRTQPIDSPVWFDIIGDTQAQEMFHVVQVACDLRCIAEGGNGDGQFDVERGSGVIIVAQALDAKRRSSYNLTVQATDGDRSISTQVLIKVTDTKEHRPQFSQAKYEISIPEDTAPGTKILEISVTDKDERRTWSYTLLSSTDPFSLRKFRLDRGTGFLYTMEELDHETMHTHVLTVMVRDQDVPVKSNLVRVVVTVEDGNDNTPQFTSARYSARVLETADVGSAVLQVSALDKDKGQNAEVVYSIESGNDGGSFSIDAVLGIIYVEEQLDSDLRNQFNLTVKASDQGRPPLSKLTTVQIFVTVPDGARPRFPQGPVSAEISEGAPVGSSVGVVTASSQSPVSYQIKGGNSDDTFEINPNTGTVVTRRMMDYETQPLYELTVRGTNMAGMWSDTTVIVSLKDENDNAPVFTQMDYVGFVSEAAGMRSVVLTDGNKPLVIQAVDTDEDSRLVYQILEPYAHKYLAIDPGTGVLQTAASLDYEQRNVFHFTVQVHDAGKPCLFSERAANVTIHVIDVNDCAPKFSQDVYEASLLLPTYNGVWVTMVRATDEDSPHNARLAFSISDGNVGGKFRVDAITGDVFLQNATQLLSKYRLTIRVSDGRFASTAVVKVTLMDNIDHGLKFTQDIFTASVIENSLERKTLAVIAAVGTRVQEPLFFSILNPSKRFEIGRTSGVLFSKGIPFDREEQGVHEVIVEVAKEQRSAGVAHVLVKVTVLDQNDNAPVFVDLPYSSVVQIDAEVGTVFREVTAVDKDSGNNAALKYRLKEQDKYFDLSPTGEIFLKRPFEEECLNKQFVISIVVEDAGDVPLSSTAQMSITVVNKATPVFEKPFYNIEIPEDVQLHASVVQVLTHSSAGPRCVYSISQGDPLDQFAIHFNSGVIQVIRPLDYEAHPAYRLSVRATDSRTGASAEVFVDIILEDVNDNAPSFEVKTYSRSLPESAMIGSSVLTVTATDSDSGRNQALVYELVEDGGTISEYFSIDSETGLIVTAGLLDHEERRVHRLMVRAEDGGIPPLSSEAEVIIHVTDLNNNPPLFAQQVYHAAVGQLAPDGQFLTRVRADDADSSDTGRLEYSILSGNEDNIFSIKRSSGEIVISSRRKQKLEPLYSIMLSVTDGVFRGTAELRVSVTGTNEHSPSFPQGEYPVELLENSPTDTLVMKVEALDKDAGVYGQVQYFIVNDVARDKFAINENGEIYTVDSLDRENPAERLNVINVMAKDGGGRVGFCFVSVALTDVNDNAPQFSLSEYKASVPGDAPRGTTVIKVAAVDPDEGAHGEVVYFMDSDVSHFEIDPFSGAIVTKGSLTGLENGLYTFYVRAKDSGSPPKKSVSSVSVQILPPGMAVPNVELLLRLELAEDLPVGTEIDVVRAQSKQPVMYALVKGNTPESNRDDNFVINSDTGNLKLIKRFDRETTEWYQLTVQMQSEVEGMEIVSTADVIVQVKDVNDNVPQFSSHPYRSFVVENLPGGASVVQVQATDLDSGLNGKVTYRLDENQECPEVQEMFSVDRETGWVRTLRQVDRERRDRYQVVVLATDSGQDGQRTGSTTVEVVVVDENDNPPVFSETLLHRTVWEDKVTPGTVITTLSVTDADSQDANRKLSCFITGGDPQGWFGVEYAEEQWMVVAQRSLDREEKDYHLLNITATDGTFVAKSAVEITVLDANDNSPVCDKTQYKVSVPEDVQTGELILQVTATDADILSNGQVQYQLSGSGSEFFTIHPDSGALRTLLTFDREQRDVYNLAVRAVDGGGRSCQAEVIVTVDDVNDNAPTFVSDPLRISVVESTAPGAYLGRLQATDADAGLNGSVRFSCEDSAGGLFSIQDRSGIVVLEKPFRRETTYTLRVRAVDQGSPRQLSRLGMVLVTVLDENVNPLVFERRDYVTTVSEDVAMGTRLLRVFAASKDVEANAHISYSITHGNERRTFSIEPLTGDVFVTGRLDFEVSREHYLTVQASSGSQSLLSDSATITVSLVDVNDNAPVFSQAVYSAAVREDAPVGSSVVMVVATDIDGPANSRVRLSIADGNKGSVFMIDSVSGVVQVARPLDRETVSGYTLSVLAADSGNPPRSSSAVVRVAVADVNDNPPTFAQANYSLVIQEGLPQGSAVLQLSVTDSDSPSNGPPFSFTILQGNEGGVFHVDQRGALRTSVPLSAREKDLHELLVQAWDSGSPPLQSALSVSIRVVPASLRPPSVLPLDVFISVVGGEYPGGELGRVHATDPDVYGTLTFGLVPPTHPLFTVSSANGTLWARGPLDEGSYALNVSVTDGRFVAVGTVSVQVRRVTQRTLEGAVLVRFAGVGPGQFLAERWRGFQRTVRVLFGVRRSEMRLVSLQPAEPMRGDLDVLLSFDSPAEGVVRKLRASARVVREMSGLGVLWVTGGRCSGSGCPDGPCREVFRLDRTTVRAFSAPRISIISHPFFRTAQCLCTEGSCKNGSVPCAGARCVPGTECAQPLGTEPHSCVCPEHGRESCAGMTSMTSMTFRENSFIRLRPQRSAEEGLRLSLWLRTTSSSGTVMSVTGRDYSILQVVAGRLQHRFACGGGSAMVSVHSAQVNDGQWHSVILEETEGRARLVLDQVHSASGTVAPGSFCSSKMEQPLVLGGRARVPGAQARRSVAGAGGLLGCMDAVVLNGQKLGLPMEDSPWRGQVEQVEGVAPGCDSPPPPCSSNPCLNGGSCSPTPPTGYVCRCSPSFSGVHCDVATQPCASNPCLYGGTCTPILGGFHCQCRGRYSGERCQMGPYCKENPCGDRGRCIESLDGPVCECQPGFTGERCESDVDECVDSVCLNGGHCVNTNGSFTCACAPGYGGKVCEVRGQPPSSPSRSPSAAVVVGLFLVLLAMACVLVPLFVILRKGVHKPGRPPAEQGGRPDSTPSDLTSDREPQPGRDAYLDTPRAAPVRPMTYTAGAGGNGRVNQVKGLGSEVGIFNPDPVFGLRKTVAVCSVAPNLPCTPPGANSVSRRSWASSYSAADLQLCLVREPSEDACGFHGNGARVVKLHSFSSHSDLMEENGYHWDTSDWLQGDQTLGVPGVQQCEFAGSPFPVYLPFTVTDMDYLSGGEDIQAPSHNGLLSPARNGDQDITPELTPPL